MSRGTDIMLGGSAIYWALDGWAAGHAATTVGFTVTALNFAAGVLFLTRRKAVREGSVREACLCLASVPASMLALAAAPPPGEWPAAPRLLFALAGAVAMASMLALGRSFGVLPAVRRLVVRGPFAWVRHPLYACELAMVYACALAAGSANALVLAAVATWLVTLRVRVEERVLGEVTLYADYAAKVRFRLVPLLW